MIYILGAIIFLLLISLSVPMAIMQMTPWQFVKEIALTLAHAMKEIAKEIIGALKKRKE